MSNTETPPISPLTFWPWSFLSDTHINMGVQMCSLYAKCMSIIYCNNPKQGQTLFIVFSRITWGGLVALSAFGEGEGGSASAVCLASMWYLRLHILGTGCFHTHTAYRGCTPIKNDASFHFSASTVYIHTHICFHSGAKAAPLSESCDQKRHVRHVYITPDCKNETRRSNAKL